MNTPHIRDTDPPDFDPRPKRQVDPTLWAAELGYGKWSVKLYGYALLIVVIGVAIVGTNVWAAMRSTGEHHAQALEDQKTRCVLALSIEQRAALLSDRAPGSWQRACWWMETDR